MEVKSSVKITSDSLENLIKAFKHQKMYAKVGILDDKNARDDAIGNTTTRSGDSGESQSNATIGLKHEFGSKKLPKRSFLRMPLIEKLSDKISKSKLLKNGHTMKKVIDEGSLHPLYDLIGGVGQDIVLEAFETGGFGKWTPSDMSRKKIHQTLVETHQLRDSISFEVVK